MLPCRQVCFDFAKSCVKQLQPVSFAGMTTALCDLLPVYDGTPDKCIMPPGFDPKIQSESKYHLLDMTMFRLIEIIV